MLIRIATAAACVLLFAVTGCNEIKSNVALAGPMRYKSELSAQLLEIKDQIEKHGEVSDGAVSKLEGVLSRWAGDMQNRSSYTHTQEALNNIKTGKTNPPEKFRANQQAGMYINLALDALKTEVQ